MPTSIEQLGQLHTNLNDFPKNNINSVTLDKSGFHNFVTSMLKGYENAPLALNLSTAQKGIHDGAPNPTIGYGFDLAKWGSWATTKSLLIWALGGQANLTSQQLQGIQLIESWRIAYASNASDVDSKRNIVLGNGSATEKAAIASILFTETQASNVLEAMVFGNASAGITGDTAYLNNVRNIARNNFNISGDFPESLELAAMINMRFRGDFTGFNNPLETSIFNSNQDKKYSTDGAKRAEFWYRILAKSTQSSVPAQRLRDSADMFGAFSKEADTKTTAQNALEGVSLLFREHYTAAQSLPIIKNIFTAKIKDGMALIKAGIPEAAVAQVAQLAYGTENLSPIVAAVTNGLLNDYMEGSSDKNMYLEAMVMTY